MSSFFSKLWSLVTGFFPTIDVDITTKSVSVSVVPSREDLEKMSKKEIDILASEEYGINLDRRKSKSAMIDQLFAKLDEQN